VAPRPLPRAQLGAALARPGRVARLLAPQADLPRRVARPPGEARRARGRLGRERGRVRLPASGRRPAAARARPGPLVARAAVSRVNPWFPREPPPSSQFIESHTSPPAGQSPAPAASATALASDLRPRGLPRRLARSGPL